MSSFSKLKREIEIVRRALNSENNFHEKAEEVTQLLGDYQRSVELEAAELTEESARALTGQLVREPESIEDAVRRAHIQNVLSEYAQRETKEP